MLHIAHIYKSYTPQTVTILALTNGKLNSSHQTNVMYRIAFHYNDVVFRENALYRLFERILLMKYIHCCNAIA